MEPDPFSVPMQVAAPPVALIPGWPARRLAGVVELVVGATSAVDLLVSLDQPGQFEVRAVVPIIFDFVIGFSLIAGSQRWVPWAIIRAVLGALIWSAISAMQGNYCGVPLQLMASGALLGLLIGDASRARTVVSLGVAGLYLVAYAILFALAMFAPAMP